MSISDTSPTVQRMQAEIFRRMTGEQRLKIACDLSDALREMAMARIRHEHPDWSERRINVELVRIALLPHPLPAGIM
jgi:hypothetical protein